MRQPLSAAGFAARHARYLYKHGIRWREQRSTRCPFRAIAARPVVYRDVRAFPQPLVVFVARAARWSIS
jgi:hypothetical protein